MEKEKEAMKELELKWVQLTDTLSKMNKEEKVEHFKKLFPWATIGNKISYKEEEGNCDLEIICYQVNGKTEIDTRIGWIKE